ncbi:hypothetical protein AMJ50_01255 [Parcubacteria bacterium DG_74_3]|nr:MAG: hypothetical protein AMJ50_01255 [Parcubacteria bacterium DG_74_3]
MWNRLSNFQTKSIAEGALILGISALISRVLGLIRDGLLMAKFGASPDLDVYFTAFRVPDLVYNVLIGGGIVVAFLPLFSETYSKEKQRAWWFTNNTLNIFLFLLIFLCLALFIFTPSIIRLIAPGFNFQQRTQTILLTRLMFLSPIFFGLSSIFSGILQYFNRFLVYSICPILYNLGIVLGIIFISPYFGILGVALGVILGAALHFFIQIPSAISCGFRYKPIFDFKTPELKRVFTLMVPRIFGMAAQQINLIFMTAIASMLSSGSITIFNLANNIQYFPIGIIGISWAVAGFPRLAATGAKDKKEEFVGIFFSVFRKILFLIIPISFLIFILKAQIIIIISQLGALILGTSQFSNVAVRLTAASLGLFCLGLWAASVIPLILRTFFALQDTKTPTLITIFAVTLNIILSFTLVELLKSPNYFQFLFKEFFKMEGIEQIEVLGLPLAFSLSSIFQCILLLVFLLKKLTDTRPL